MFVYLIESQIGGERGGGCCFYVAPLAHAIRNLDEFFLKLRQVEFILQTGAPGFKHDGKGIEVQGRRHQLLCLQPAHPQRQPLVKALSWQQQEPAGTLAKARTEKS